jgi:Fic family protein
MKQPNIILGQASVRLIAEIDEFKSRWDALKTLSPDRLKALRKVATVESVGSSTRIEGAKLTDAEVEQLLSNIRMQSFHTRDEQEVAGYAEAMDLVFQAYEDLRLTENHIGQLHQTLLRHSEKDERHRGSYKTLRNDVVAYDANGSQIGVVFETTTPFDAPRDMEALVAWTRKAIVQFLAIHPFQGDNGRLSRVLTTLLLLRVGYVYVPYASLERVVEENKDIYYKALRRTQTTLKGDKPDWEPWIGFFLRALKKQKDSLAIRLGEERQRQSADDQLPALSVEILSLFETRERLTPSQIETALGANRNTLKVRLRELVAAGRIKRHGKARATWYTRGCSFWPKWAKTPVLKSDYITIVDMRCRLRDFGMQLSL